MNGYWVDPEVLRQAAGVWADQVEELHAAVARLETASASVDSLGERVAPSARRFLQTWHDAARQLAGDAQAHGNALAEAGRTYAVLDAEAATAFRALLSWQKRHITLEPLRATDGLEQFVRAPEAALPPAPWSVQ